MNNKISNNNICYYCGKIADGGKQHIPARNFFPNGMRENLIKVPSCKAHNQGIQKLEERCHFQFFIQSRSPEAEKHSEKLINELDRPERKLFRDSLANNYRDIDSERGGLFIDMSVIDEYMKYLVSGLYFYHTNMINNGEIKLINNKEEPEKFYNALCKFPGFNILKEGNACNKDIFNYKYCFFNPKNKINEDSFWYLNFYKEISYIAVINNLIKD
jgi:hypothetical protein